MTNIYSKRASKADVNAEIAKLSIMSAYLASEFTTNESGSFTPDEHPIALTSFFNYQGSSPISMDNGGFSLPGGFMYRASIELGYLTGAASVQIALFPDGATSLSDMVNGSQVGLTTGNSTAGRAGSVSFYLNLLEATSAARYFYAVTYTPSADCSLYGGFGVANQYPLTASFRQLFSA